MKKTKKELVEQFLNSLMESDSFTIDDLMELTVDELAQKHELKEIGKITISTVLADYKNKYEDDFFKEIDEGLLTEAGGIENGAEDDQNSSSAFSQDEILVLKQMIQQRAEPQNAELIELKLALKNAGIDYSMILKDYRTQKEIELGEWEDSISSKD